VVFVLRHFLFVRPGLVSLLSLVASGVAIYLTLIHFFRLAAYQDMRCLLREGLAARHNRD